MRIYTSVAKKRRYLNLNKQIVESLLLDNCYTGLGLGVGKTNPVSWQQVI